MAKGKKPGRGRMHGTAAQGHGRSNKAPTRSSHLFGAKAGMSGSGGDHGGGHGGHGGHKTKTSH